MNFVKRLFGWGGSEQTEAREAEEEQQQKPQDQRRQAMRQQPGERPAPVVADCPSGDGGVQGLDWFRRSMLRDSEGDCAHSFMEEPDSPNVHVARQQQQQHRQQARQQQPHSQHKRQRHHAEGGGQAGSGQDHRQSPLQCNTRRAQRVGPADVLIDQGNVVVVPHTD